MAMYYCANHSYHRAKSTPSSPGIIHLERKKNIPKKRISYLTIRTSMYLYLWVNVTVLENFALGING